MKKKLIFMKFLEFDTTRDFPYYRNNPRISKKSWIGLLILLPISFLTYSLLFTLSEFVASVAFCLVLLIPLLYVSKWEYSLFIRKPTKDEITLAILMFLGYAIYSIIVATALENFDLVGLGIDAAMTVTFESIVSLLFSMLAEELIKFIPLMFFLRLFYRYTENRKLSIVFSTAIVLVGFGMLHYAPPYSTLPSVLLLQGLGSIFEVYGYLKTKNIFVPYLSHLLTDAIAFIMIFVMG